MQLFRNLFSASKSLSDWVKLTAAIRRVAVRAYQQRYVVVLRCVVDPENDRYLRIKTLDFKALVIGLRFKYQPVSAAGERFANEEKRLYAAVLVGPGMA